MKNKLIFLALIATGMVLQVEACAARAAIMARRFSFPIVLAGTTGWSVYQHKKDLDKHYEIVEEKFNQYHNTNFGIDKLRLSYIKQRFEKHGFSLVIALFDDSYEALDIDIGVMKGRDNKVILLLNSAALGVLLNLPQKIKWTMPMLDAVIDHELAHVINDDQKQHFMIVSMKKPFFLTTMFVGYQAAKRLRIKNKMGNMLGLTVGAALGLVGGAFCFGFSFLWYSRFCEERADQAVFEIGNKDKIQALKGAFKLLEDFPDTPLEQEIARLPEGMGKKTLKIFLGLSRTHPTHQERIAACDKALEKLEQEELNKVD